jgi:hypothetical protein
MSAEATAMGTAQSWSRGRVIDKGGKFFVDETGTMGDETVTRISERVRSKEGCSADQGCRPVNHGRLGSWDDSVSSVEMVRVIVWVKRD